MSNFQDDITRIVSESSDTIKEQVVKNLQESVINELTYNMRSQVTNIVAEYVKDELQEEVKKILVEAKPTIVEELKKSIVAACGEIAKSMVIQAKTTMSDRWKVKKICETLFDN